MARRQSYETRTRSNSQGAKILAEAFSRQTAFTTNAAGDKVRVWTKEDYYAFSDDDIGQALRGQRAFEADELGDLMPASTIKYVLSKGWLLFANALYFVTDKARDKFALPRKAANGLTIKFAKAA